MPYGAYESPELIEAAYAALRETKDSHHFKRAQAILLPHLLGLSLAQVAQALGTSEISVARWRKEFLLLSQGQPDKRKNWGGSRKRNLSPLQEEELLASFEKKALMGGILTIGEIQQAYEEQVGHRVRNSVVYRMLKRHGWRKLAPQRRHPKAKDREQEEWKKKRCWMPCNSPSSSKQPKGEGSA